LRPTTGEHRSDTNSRNIHRAFPTTYSPHSPKPAPPASYSVAAMATPAQIQANRLNAQKSTGPRSAEGKAASRFKRKRSRDSHGAVLSLLK
jgi:hypothetical protein